MQQIRLGYGNFQEINKNWLALSHSSERSPHPNFKNNLKSEVSDTFQKRIHKLPRHLIHWLEFVPIILHWYHRAISSRLPLQSTYILQMENEIRQIYHQYIEPNESTGDDRQNQKNTGSYSKINSIIPLAFFISSRTVQWNKNSRGITFVSNYSSIFELSHPIEIEFHQHSWSRNKHAEFHLFARWTHVPFVYTVPNIPFHQ